MVCSCASYAFDYYRYTMKMWKQYINILPLNVKYNGKLKIKRTQYNEKLFSKIGSVSITMNNICLLYILDLK